MTTYADAYHLDMVDETPYVREPGYARRYRDVRFCTGSGPRTHRREVRAIERLLQIASAAKGPWLDVPSGAGRLTHLLPDRSIRVDRDSEMLRAAGSGPRVCASARALPWRSETFSGVLCMRLLQHISNPPERVAILTELRRVSRGPLVVSFFHAASLQHLRRVLDSLIRRRHSRRVALSARRFKRELQAAGWQVRAHAPLRRFVSEQWLVLAEPRTPQVDATGDPKQRREDRNGRQFVDHARDAH